MNGDEGRLPSAWTATKPLSPRPPLAADTEAEVCVVGAGIAGLSTAYLLAREGVSVVVLDDGEVGSGETGRTTAHLSHAIDDRYVELERLHGSEGARRAAESHTAAIDRIEAIAAEEKIDCGFERLDGYLFSPKGESIELLQRELLAAHRAGLGEVSLCERAPLDSFHTGPCLRFPRQAQFHPLRYLAGLARALERDGGRIFTGTHAARLVAGDPVRVETDSGPAVTARHVVVATNSPMNDRLVIHTKQSAYRSYVVALRMQRPPPRALLWDTADPYHYVRRLGPDGSPESDVLLVGGEDHKTGQADDGDARFARLRAWAEERFGPASAEVFRWSGQVMETIDGLAYLGRNPLDRGNVYIATGDSGMGMTHGTIGAMLITDLIQGRPNRWASLYDPGRVTLRAAAEFTRENLNVAAQLKDLVTGGDVADPSAIAPGSGAVVRRGLRKIAVYRDPSGALHECSAVCPHLGCIVAWNSAESSWDCPCHGSRFDPTGAVLNGPAAEALRPVSDADDPPHPPHGAPKNSP